MQIACFILYPNPPPQDHHTKDQLLSYEFMALPVKAYMVLLTGVPIPSCVILGILLNLLNLFPHL